MTGPAAFATTMLSATPPAMLSATTLVWAAANWLAVASGFAALLLLLLVWSYSRGVISPRVRMLAAGLKALGVLVLAACLLEPLFSGTRARPGANLFVVLADNSQSMALRDRGQRRTRGEELKSLAARRANWLSRIGQDFDLRQYAFDTQLRALPEFDTLAFDGGASNLAASLERVVRRYQGRPLAGVLLLTDGNATDAEAVEKLLGRGGADSGRSLGGERDAARRPSSPDSGGVHLPPVYPVVLGSEDAADDINVAHVAVTQTNFEDAPVTLAAQVASSGYRGKTIVADLVDENGKTVETQKVKVDQDAQPLTVRFRLRPEHPGVSFYRVRATAEGAPLPAPAPASMPATTAAKGEAAAAGVGVPSAGPGGEATLANNSRLVAVDRGQGPYRVLYVSGRPNWEFKFLRRAIWTDDQVKLTGLIRLAKREPKFNFIGRRGDAANPFYRGFDNRDKDEVQEYDQPVIVRLDPSDANELRGGFPKTPEELFDFHAVILDDVESEFFTQDQMLLIKDFVRQRGGGLLMLGGQESFKNGRYDRTPLGDLMPVYADEVPAPPPDARYRITLTREGMLEPWVRLRGDEDAERKRLEAMPAFQVLNQVRGIKPGATVLATAQAEGGAAPVPALVEQRFGQGRAAALLVGDLWRWSLRRPENANGKSEDDLGKAWRQIVRWMVAEVPQRVDCTVGAGGDADGPDGTLRIGVCVRGPSYAPLDNAAVTVRVTGPDGKPVELRGEPSERQAGLYEAVYVPRQPGAYRAQVTATAPDGSEVGKVQAGWTSDPAAEEFKDLKPNRALLDRLARATGGQLVPAGELESFVASLPTRHAEITEPYVRPVWHQPWVFALAIVCLCAEWGLRRWKGFP